MTVRICAAFEPLAATCDHAATVCEEVLLRPPNGKPGHWWVQVEKRGLGTSQARQAIARAAAVPVEAVGCAGHRDRQAKSVQWFSVPTELCEHPGPLRRAGAHGRMHVSKLISNHKAVSPASVARLRWKLKLKGGGGLYMQARAMAERLRQRGLPNRIGRIDDALARWGDLLLAGRRLPESVGSRRPDPRRLMLAAQGDRFNRWLDARIADNLLDKVLAGDRIQSDRLMIVDDADAWTARVTSWEVAVCGPLIGAGMPEAKALAAVREETLLTDVDPRQLAKIEGGVRPCRIHPGRLGLDPDGKDLIISADLPAEVFTDALLIELLGHVDGRPPAEPEDEDEAPEVDS